MENIIINALNQYDEAIEIVKKIVSKCTISITYSNNNYKRGSIQFTDNKSGIKIETDFEWLAIFYEKINLWSWAWSLPGLKESENYLSKDILKYSLNLDANMSYIKLILSTSRGIINDTTQIGINLAICTYIIKHPFVYPQTSIVDGYEYVKYLVLIDNEKIKSFFEKIN